MQIETTFTSDTYHPQHFLKDGVSVRYLGSVQGRNTGEAILTAVSANGVLQDSLKIGEALRSLSGNFCFVVQDRRGNVLAAVDKIRSYPLFYQIDKSSVRIGLDPHSLILSTVAPQKNREALLEFACTGYVTAGETLYQNLLQLQAGQYLYVSGVGAEVGDYYLFYDPRSLVSSRQDFIEALWETTKSIFTKLAARLNGRPVFVPLSAGLDSRLTLCMLKMVGYENLQTFSYGVKGNHEARAASSIARSLGVKWRFFPYTRSVGRNFFASELYGRYTRFAHSYAMLPPIMDIIALEESRRQKLLPADAVFINGLSGDFISGSHIPEVFTRSASVDEEIFFDAIIKKHYGFWTNLLTAENVAIITSRIRRVTPLQLPSAMEPEQAMKLYECWDWRARQAIHVVNCQRAYDFMGLAWELPLWDDEYLAFWAQIPLALKFRQRLYREFLDTVNPLEMFRGIRYPAYIASTTARILQSLCAVFGQRQEAAAHRFLAYWQNFSYYYALYPYREYLKYSAFHRQAGSYHVKHLLEHEYGESIFT